MRLFLILTLLTSYSVWAGPCQDAWEADNKKEKPASSCVLEWASEKGPRGIELVTLEKGCALGDKNFEKCALLRACGPGSRGDIGSSFFRASSPMNSYCLSGKDLEVFSPRNDQYGKAFIICSGVRKPAGIKLVSPDLKTNKTCPFPFQTEGNL